MTVLEFATNAANKLQIVHDFPMAAILDGSIHLRMATNSAYSIRIAISAKMQNSIAMRRLSNRTIKDIIAEMPFAANLSNPNWNEFVVHSGNFGIWRLLP